MMERNCTQHCGVDRSDRWVFIEKTVGRGNIIKEVRQVDEKGRVSWQCLTDTGVLMVLSEDKKKVITVYIASQPKVSAMYQGKTPSWLIAKVRNNRKYAEQQNKVGK